MYEDSNILWTDGQTQLLRDLYPFHSNTELSLVFSKSAIAVRKKGNKLGLFKDKESLRRINSESLRKYTMDENYFEDIDTPDKAYILGFLLGDGNVDKNFFRLSIHIHERDREVLEYIKEQLKTDAPIRRTRETMISLRISSYKLIMDLSKWHMIPQKAHVLEMPDLKEDLQPHLVRGLFDADGSVSGQRYCRINIRGNGKALEKVNQIVDKQARISNRKVCKYDGTSIWSINNQEQVSKFAQWLYKDATFFLTRKYDKFIEAGLLQRGTNGM
jgi:hypothetical protein